VALTEQFILNNKNLFEDGDFFTGCPECENGGPGDPRMNGDAEGHRLFLIREYDVATKAFKTIGKNVSASLHSMNYDVARLIMNKPTTKALGGIVAIDHYVKSPVKLASDIRNLAEYSGGKIFLGEFGAPIPDIHGRLTDEQQATWISDALAQAISEPALIGVNYWVNVGGSTELWNQKDAKPAVAALTSFYTPRTIEGSVVDQFDKPIAKAKVKTKHRETTTDALGRFILPVLSSDTELYIQPPEEIETTTQIDTFAQNAKIIIKTPYNYSPRSILDHITKLFY
jgi:hypothetical protein